MPGRRIHRGPICRLTRSARVMLVDPGARFSLGSAGLTISTLNAYYTYVKLAKLGELARIRESRE